MSQAQTAIVPEAGPFALYTQLKVNQNRENVLDKLKALPKLVEELNITQPGAALTHPELGTNVCYTHSLKGGDIDAAFKKADRVIKQRIVHQRLTPMPIEPRGVVASYHAGEGTLTLWTSTQVPHLVKLLLPSMLGIPENKIRVIAPEVGGGFGAKLNVYAEEALCSHLAMRLGAPMKWIESRRDNAAATIHGRDQIGEYEVAVKKDGDRKSTRLNSSHRT